MTREEKQKAIDALKISAPVIVVTQEEFKDYIQTLNKIMDWLEQEPSVLPKVPEGYWFDRGSLSCRCSNCGCKSNKESAYCPNCGAKMEEPQESEDKE